MDVLFARTKYYNSILGTFFNERKNIEKFYVPVLEKIVKSKGYTNLVERTFYLLDVMILLLLEIDVNRFQSFNEKQKRIVLQNLFDYIFKNADLLSNSLYLHRWSYFDLHVMKDLSKTNALIEINNNIVKLLVKDSLFNSTFYPELESLFERILHIKSIGLSRDKSDFNSDDFRDSPTSAAIASYSSANAFKNPNALNKFITDNYHF